MAILRQMGGAPGGAGGAHEAVGVAPNATVPGDATTERNDRQSISQRGAGLLRGVADRLDGRRGATPVTANTADIRATTPGVAAQTEATAARTVQPAVELRLTPQDRVQRQAEITRITDEVQRLQARKADLISQRNTLQGTNPDTIRRINERFPFRPGEGKRGTAATHLQLIDKQITDEKDGKGAFNRQAQIDVFKSCGDDYGFLTQQIDAEKIAVGFIDARYKYEELKARPEHQEREAIRREVRVAQYFHDRAMIDKALAACTDSSGNHKADVAQLDAQLFPDRRIWNRVLDFENSRMQYLIHQGKINQQTADRYMEMRKLQIDNLAPSGSRPRQNPNTDARYTTKVEGPLDNVASGWFGKFVENHMTAKKDPSDPNKNNLDDFIGNQDLVNSLRGLNSAIQARNVDLSPLNGRNNLPYLDYKQFCDVILDGNIQETTVMRAMREARNQYDTVVYQDLGNQLKAAREAYEEWLSDIEFIKTETDTTDPNTIPDRINGTQTQIDLLERQINLARGKIDLYQRELNADQPLTQTDNQPNAQAQAQTPEPNPAPQPQPNVPQQPAQPGPQHGPRPVEPQPQQPARPAEQQPAPQAAEQLNPAELAALQQELQAADTEYQGLTDRVRRGETLTPQQTQRLVELSDRRTELTREITAQEYEARFRQQEARLQALEQAANEQRERQKKNRKLAWRIGSIVAGAALGIAAVATLPATVVLGAAIVSSVTSVGMFTGRSIASARLKSDRELLEIAAGQENQQLTDAIKLRIEKGEKTVNFFTNATLFTGTFAAFAGIGGIIKGAGLAGGGALKGGGLGGGEAIKNAVTKGMTLTKDGNWVNFDANIFSNAAGLDRNANKVIEIFIGNSTNGNAQKAALEYLQSVGKVSPQAIIELGKQILSGKTAAAGAQVLGI
ncbi:hypothetical protein JW887_04510 [Candidatus Dojkabacteria bacterium]|nr:hypothetical protein [Candidatus Dojkabacteria bacterium]